MADESDEPAAHAEAPPAEEAGEQGEPDEPEDVEMEGTEDDGEDGDEVDAEATASDDDELDGIQSGDVVRLDYTAYAAESGRLVDTTDPEVAEEEGVDDENRTFEPRVIALGQGQLFDAVESALEGLEPGDTGDVVVPALEAFGVHDTEQVQTVSADKIPEDSRYPGAHVDVDGRHGFIETIIGGRARVDFNHPLAGEDIEYEFEVLDVIEDRIELAEGLIRTYLDMDLDVWVQTDEVEADEGDETVESLYIEATPALAMNQQWLFQKQEIAGQLIEQVGVDRIVVQEILESRDQVLEETRALLEDEGIEDVEDLVETEE